MSCPSVCEKYDVYIWSEEEKCAGSSTQILINQVKPQVEKRIGVFKKYKALKYRDRQYDNGHSFLYLVKVDTDKGYMHLKIADDKIPCDPCSDVKLCGLRMGHSENSCMYDFKREIE